MDGDIMPTIFFVVVRFVFYTIKAFSDFDYFWSPFIKWTLSSDDMGRFRSNQEVNALIKRSGNLRTTKNRTRKINSASTIIVRKSFYLNSSWLIFFLPAEEPKRTETGWAPQQGLVSLCNTSGFDRRVADSSLGPYSQPNCLKDIHKEFYYQTWAGKLKLESLAWCMAMLLRFSCIPLLRGLGH